MKKAVLAVIALTLGTPGIAQAASGDSEKPIEFTPRSGEKVAAFEGSFEVPENRVDPKSRTLTLRYVRFPATGEKAGPPIIYLAGGPGGSGIGTAKRQRFPLFMAMREFGDVIAFDQRGTGASNDLPRCTSSVTKKGFAVISDARDLLLHKDALKECLSFWKEKGVDVHAYNTPENVRDLDALRKHLGTEKITLWGISYGSHLSLAALKQIDDRLDKVVIASAEGLDQTIKQPLRTDAYFDRLQLAINSQPQTKQQFPDVKALMRRVHIQLEKKPMLLKIPQKDGSIYEYLFQRRDMQNLASGLISDPVYASLLMQVYRAIDRDDSGLVQKIAPFFISSKEQIGYSAMSVLMDIASGTSADRRALLNAQAKNALLGSYLNQPVELEDVDPTLVLGDDFRSKPVSNVPLLLLSGTLDGRTYVKSQLEAVSGLSNLQTVAVRNAGHNLFMASPDVTAAIKEFMKGSSVDGRVIDIELPNLLTAGFDFLKRQ